MKERKCRKKIRSKKRPKRKMQEVETEEDKGAEKEAGGIRGEGR